jgi:lipopolysaccharide biosynthesis glycosyltransferase
MSNNIPIFLASDDNYAPFVATTIASVCYNTDSNIDFYVLDSGISIFNKKRIENLKENFKNFTIEFIKVDSNEVFKGFRDMGYFTIAMYNRFLIPLLKLDLDKVIYMDVDIVVLGDIAELYNTDLENYIIGAVEDETEETAVVLKNKKFIQRKINIGIEKNPYFNSGVILINCKKWRENDMTNKLFDIEKQHHNAIEYPDQDILNIAFSSNYKHLDRKFNFVNWYADHNHTKTEPLLRHFSGGGDCKPWRSNKSKNSNEFWYFAEMTSFYAGLHESYMASLVAKKGKIIYKLFGIIPFIKVKNTNYRSRYYLFEVIPLMVVREK